MESLQELCQFLKQDCNPTVLSVALDNLLGVSGSPDGLKLAISCDDLLKCLLLLINHKIEGIQKTILLCLINLSADESGAKKLIKIDQTIDQVTIKLLLEITLNPNQKNADAASMVLCNLSRVEENLNNFVNHIINHMGNILDAFTNTNFNQAGSKLHYLGPLLSNLSGNYDIRQWLCDNEKSKNGVTRIASFCNYQESITRRGGACGTIRNICFDVERHSWLLSSDVDLLTYLLMPLIGGEEYDEDEMDKLPIALQYQSQDKRREDDPDIRKILLECLLRLCVKRDGREYLRNNGTYYVLREYHKWEKDGKALLACENVVDILIRKEEEVGLDDITTVDVPAEYNEKFAKLDEEFLQNVQ